MSQVALENGSEGLTVDVERADGVKCERCWKYTLDVGRHPRFPTICAVCGTAVDEILSDSHA